MAAIRRGLSGVRILSGGEMLPSPVARRLLALGAEVENLYGPTETTVWCTTGAVRADDDGAPRIGTPLDTRARTSWTGTWACCHRAWWVSCTSRDRVWPAGTSTTPA
ncbi:hypothetical protein D3C57_143755 [Streptomyces rapamycinicus NRRL 5491]|uniref:AMP-dependent synthetase/ligase domain-containing protein n=1 Tax=Streptomyces rapamycinicus (strain ATCC 29253 / DSM 41530 / NRRL 5491 / AYB-994) TaxID=1343740 RepID=A0A3L8R1A6_STRRN|nr:hypothetical protein D3C57_143755 [Streptomyces rapamycinicus NRRL 5491]